MNAVLLSAAQAAIKKMVLPNFSFGYELVKCKAALVLITQ